MATKSDEHKVTLTGPGLSFTRPVSQDVANQIINLVMTGAVAPAAPTGGVPRPGAYTDTPAAAATGDILPKQFISQKKPDNDYQRVACLAYYLTHHRATPQFKTRDITKISRDAGVHLINPSQAVKHAASTYRYLMAAGSGKKQITNLGEAVVDALPDREAVKRAIAEIRPKRRKRRQRQK
jgi:hypothetical protein